MSALDDLVDQHRDTQLTLTTWQGSREVLLADANWLPSPFFRGHRPLGDEDDGASGLILADVFRSWWAGRPAELRSGPLDALHAYAAAATAITVRPPQPWARIMAERNAWWAELVAGQVDGPVGVLRHPGVVGPCPELADPRRCRRANRRGVPCRRRGRAVGRAAPGH